MESGPRLRALLVFALLGLISCRDDDPGGDVDAQAAARCAAVVDHVVDLQPGADTSPELAKHRAILRDVVEGRVMEDCMSRSRAHAECVLAAGSAADVMRCGR